MIRAASILLAMVLLLGLGYLAGRLPDTAESARRNRTLPGDTALESAWEDLLIAQQEALRSLRASRFYVDDQERAEAYYAVVQDIQVAISDESAEHRDSVLLGGLPGPGSMAVQLTPNRMAQRLEQTAQRLRARSEARLRLAGNAFGPPGGGAIASEQSGLQTAIRSWELDNDEALLVRFPVAPAAGVGVSLGNVWAMSLAAAPGHSGVGERLHCTAGSDCLGILSHRDPDLPGWLDTGGHRRGVLVLRWRSDEPPPTIETLRFLDLETRLRGLLQPASLQPDTTD